MGDSELCPAGLLSLVSDGLMTSQPEKADFLERNRDEAVVQVVRGFRPAEQEIAVGLEHPSDPAQNLLPGWRVEIDEDVAQQDQVQGRQFGPGTVQIDRAELHYLADVITRHFNDGGRWGV